MSWLDDIDSKYGIQTETYPASDELGRIRRLAYVLREAINILKIDLELVGFENHQIKDDIKRHELAKEASYLLNNMSDDLKELIE